MQRQDTTQAVLWALLATALFVGVAAMAKHAASTYHVLQILFFRQIVVFLSALPSIARSFPHSLKTQHPGLHALRLAGAFVALSCGIWAVSALPLTTATTLGFTQVFFVALLALWFLGENVGAHRLGAVAVGFVGVVIVMRPGMGVFDPSALIPVVGALGAAVAVTAVRKLSQTDATATLLIYQATVVGGLAGVPLIWLWRTPDLAGLGLLLSMGVLATIGQWAGVRALRLGEASVIGNLEYMKLIYAGLVGYLLFGERPDGATILGALVIIGSSGYIFHRAATARTRPAPR